MKINGNINKVNKLKYKKLEQDIIMDGQAIEGVQNFRQLRAMTNSKNLISDEIKSNIAAGDRCFQSLRQVCKSRAMSKAAKIKIYI